LFFWWCNDDDDENARLWCVGVCWECPEFARSRASSVRPAHTTET
jgi:hypothetical protein